MTQTKLAGRFVIFLLAWLFLLLLLGFAGTHPSAHGPKLWVEREAEVRQMISPNGLAWHSLRVPPADIVEKTLRDKGTLKVDSSQSDVDLAIQSWYQDASRKFYFGPNPLAYNALLERETALLDSGSELGADESLPISPKNLLGVVVEFTISFYIVSTPADPADPSQGCLQFLEIADSLGLGDDPPPGPLDNFLFFQPFVGVAEYESAIFGTGPDAGYGEVRNDLGGVDLSGYSLNNYLAEMSGGTYHVDGGFLNETLTLPLPHEFYGQADFYEDRDGNCVNDDLADTNLDLFLSDTLAAITADYDSDASVNWSDYDADGDKIVDVLTIIHAGYGFQNGGLVDRLSTSSGALSTPLQIVGFDTPADTSDDYFVQDFIIGPEQLDIGSLQEEFMQLFGLPDLYTFDGNNSNAFWGSHSTGVWGGELGGARPVGHNLWQDWVLGWRDPMIISYDDAQLQNGGLEVEIGRARYKPEGAEDGVIVRLPDSVVDIPNLAGSGVGWYSQSGLLLDNRVYRSFDLSDADDPMLSFDAWWDMEFYWDFGLIEFSNDDGATWKTLPDEYAALTDEDPFDLIPGEAWALTHFGGGNIKIDLSSFEGDKLWIRFRYLTNQVMSKPANSNFLGWQIDNIALSDRGGMIYENDLEEDFSDWTNEDWVTVPFVNTYKRYYLLEWRDDNGFDASLNDPYWVAHISPQVVSPYITIPSTGPEIVVDRLPATTPGLQISYRDTSEGFDYSLYDSLFTGQSIGPKFAHLVIDSHFMPKRFETPFPGADNLVGWSVGGRVSSGDALFGNTQTRDWMARFDLDPLTGDTSEVKAWPAEESVGAFHDSYGYYPGVFYAPETDLVYFHDAEASAVLPAKGPYSTRITDAEGNLLADLFGLSLNDFAVGSGNPGDDHVQFGLHAEVTDSSDPRGTVRLWNSAYEVVMWSSTEGIINTNNPAKTTFAISENIGGKLENPIIVVELPVGVHYERLSAFGGMMPMIKTLQSQLGLPADGHYMVWAGEDIWTSTSVEPFGFEWTAESGKTSATFKVSMYHQDNLLFQTETFIANQYPYGLYLPQVSR